MSARYISDITHHLFFLPTSLANSSNCFDKRFTVYRICRLPIFYLRVAYGRLTVLGVNDNDRGTRFRITSDRNIL